MSFSWNSDKYIKNVEETSNLLLRDYMDAEIDIVEGVENPKEKTFIDVGAGYGRMVSCLSRIGKKLISVEIDKNLLPELKKRTEKYSNVEIIEGDAQKLSFLLKGRNIENPVLICLQNTYGTPFGDPFKILSEMVKVAEKNNGQIIISLFIQEGLKEYGIPIYYSVKELVGEPDLEKTDFEKGDFISKAGYKSHWWRPEERIKICNIVGGKKVSEITTKYFYLLHVKY